MTVSAPTTYPEQFACNGLLTDFDFTFGIYESSELEVIHTDADGVETVLTETTHYTVSATNSDFSTGGTISTVATYALGVTLTARMAVPLTQESDFVDNQATLYETFELGLDKLTRICQQLEESIGRGLSFTKSSGESGEAIVPVPSSLKYLRWNNAATALENAELVIAGDLSAHATDGNAHRGVSQALTISAGVLACASYADKGYVTVNGEGSANDTLTSITGYSTGDIVILAPATGLTITVQAGSSIRMGSDFIMDSVYDRLCLQCVGSDVMVQLYRTSNA